MNKNLVRDRSGTPITTAENTSDSLKFLYENMFGRCVLSIIRRPIFSALAGLYMNSALSKSMIPKFIAKNKIDMNDYVDEKYPNFNQFFTRRIKPEARAIDFEPDSFISPADSRLTVYQIGSDLCFKIKNSFYSVESLLCDKTLAEKFIGGQALVFRLSVDDYHRYCFFDDGDLISNKYIRGVLHTVNPVALGRYNIYAQNCREVTVIETAEFGLSAYVELGALFVGKIVNHIKTPHYNFKRGEEKGMFLFGGSTVVVLLEKNQVEIDADIIQNSFDFIETRVRFGEKIGIKNTKPRGMGQ